jgi:sec-independent protein translocase protein TatA
MLESIGWPELVVIAIVFVVLFGGKKIPEIGRGIGEGIKNFKAAMKSESEKEGEKAVEVEKV